MIRSPGKFCLISTFKENYFLLKLFFRFYSSFYGIRNFLFFCGLPESRTHANLVSFFKSELDLSELFSQKVYLTRKGRALVVTCIKNIKAKIYVVSFSAKNNTSEIDFHDLKNELFQWASLFLPKIIKRVWVVDNDEFLRCPSPELIENLPSIGFHFIELIPSKSWPPKGLYFSLQGWYYRRQIFPFFKFGGRMAFKIANLFGRGINHSGCKTYYFLRKHLTHNKSWRHGVYVCKTCKFVSANVKNFELDKISLKNQNVAYHLANVTKDQFLSEKLPLFRRLQTDKSKGRDNDLGQSLEINDLKLAHLTYTRFIERSFFPIIRDNFLLSFLNQLRFPTRLKKF